MDLLVCIYMARVGSYYRAFFTHNTELDAGILLEGSDEKEFCLDVLTTKLPIGIAEYVLHTVFTSEEISGCLIPEKGRDPRWFTWFRAPLSYDRIITEKYRSITGLLKKISDMFGDNSFCYELKGYPKKIDLNNLAGIPAAQTQWPADCLVKALAGRILFYEELQQSLREHGLGTDFDIFDALQVLALRGKARVLPSVGIISPGRLKCFRCGQKAGIGEGSWYRGECPVCRFPAVYCEQCNELGEARLCRGLFAMGQSKSPMVADHGSINGQVGVPPLTPAQTGAAAAIRDFVTKKTKKKCLLWAATGAGKTEVVLEAMAAVAHGGGRVLYTAPRRDVVMEITPRLGNALQGTLVKAVYGGSPEKFVTAPVIAATVHQVLRFYKNFDLIIFDEVDAYPYNGNVMLERAVERALKDDGQIVFMTATPSRQLLVETETGRAQLAVIPARYHGYPVPEPRILKIVPFINNGYSEQISIAPEVIQLLLKWALEKNGQVFVFLPTVKMVDTYGVVLRQAILNSMYQGSPNQDSLKQDSRNYSTSNYNKWNYNKRNFVSLSHSRDPQRDQKRECFKRGETRIFITTSIMERGITVSNAYVMVLQADFTQVYDEGTLIQMAGRAGRSAAFPHGEVVFVAPQVTEPMETAVQKIKYLNNRARKEGYLKPGW